MNTRKKSIVAGYTEPSTEDIWLNLIDNKLYFYSSKGWVEIGTLLPTPPTPEVKTKTICDTVYTLTKKRESGKWVYSRTEEFTTSNCITVAEDCEVTFTSVVDKENLIDTVTASYKCPVIRYLTSEEFEALGGTPPDVPMGETVTIK